MEYFIGWLIGLIIWGIIWGNVTNMILRNKGYSDNWFWWGFFFGFLAALVASTKTNQEMVRATKANNHSTEANEIREYKKLLDEGIITAEEFEKKKKKILGTMDTEVKAEVKEPKRAIFTEEDYRKAQRALDEDVKNWKKDIMG